MSLYSGLVSSSFIHLIHSFWLGAVEVALRMAIWPLPPMSLESSWTSLRPMSSALAWLMWTVRPPGEIAESQLTTGMFAADGGLARGDQRVGVVRRDRQAAHVLGDQRVDQLNLLGGVRRGRALVGHGDAQLFGGFLRALIGGIEVGVAEVLGHQRIGLAARCRGRSRVVAVRCGCGCCCGGSVGCSSAWPWSRPAAVSRRAAAVAVVGFRHRRRSAR